MVEKQKCCPVCNADSPKVFCEKNGLAYVRCQACSHVYVGTLASQEHLRAYYTNRQSHHQSDSKLNWDYSETKYQRHFKPILDEIVRHAPNRALLDVGCSNGAFVNAAVRSGWQACGIELETGSVEIARSHSLTVHHCALKDKQFADESFGAVTMWQLIEHLDDVPDMFSEIRRILCEGGVLAVSTPNINSIGWYLLGADWRAVEPEAHLHLFNSTSLHRILHDSGFERLTLRTADIKPSTVKDYLRGMRSRSNAAPDSGRFSDFAKSAGSFRVNASFTALKIANLALSACRIGEDIYGYYRKSA
jgi:2-polyprenyl-3-methyl-5-hydroxy-6-metoxy-1,4-benzoquinol methylase